MEKGKLIVIEGACDGIGKTTQFNLLKEYLGQYGNVVTHHFPTYNEDSGMLVEKYLKGEFGSIQELSPYFINSLYAIDRAIVSMNKIKPALDNGNIVLLDRYTTSSLIYQSANISDGETRKQFIDYVIEYEYEKLKVVAPDLVIFLTAPYDLVKKMRDERTENDGVKKDLHEINDEYMRKVYETSNYVSKLLDWETVECSENSEMKSVEEIHESIKKLIKI